MRPLERLFALTVWLVPAVGCTAPQARVRDEPEDRVAREWIGDPRGFPNAEALRMIADLARHGARSIPTTVTIDGREVEFRAVAYEAANDPYVLTPDGPETISRRGIIAWRGMPVEEVIGISARAPGVLDRPLSRIDPGSEGGKLFARRRAFRARRDTIFWTAVGGVVAVGDPVPVGPCRARKKTKSTSRATAATPGRTCADATFTTSFDLVFEQLDDAIDQALFREMMAKGVDSIPFRGISPIRISLSAVDIPGIRFVMACGTTHGAPNDSTCLSTGERPSP